MLDKLSINNLEVWIATLDSMETVRQYAIHDKLNWTDAKLKFFGSSCLLCLQAQAQLLELLQTKTIPISTKTCHVCLWSYFNQQVCGDYSRHRQAIARYTRWKQLLNLEIARREQEIQDEQTTIQSW